VAQKLTMMRTLIASLLCAITTFSVQAQSPVYRHSLNIGLERLGLDAPDGLGTRYLLQYARHLCNDRIVLQGSLGYASASNRRFLVNDYYVDGKPRQRFSSDLTVAFDFIKHPRHAFRLGGGPSLWYRDEVLFQSAQYTVNITTGAVSNVQVKWQPPVKEWNPGFNLLLEYEYALTSRLVASGKIKLVSLDVEGAGLYSIYGVGVGYRFP
jgi:hypothetical protein